MARCERAGLECVAAHLVQIKRRRQRSHGFDVRPASFTAFQCTDCVDGQPRNRRELLLSEARSLAERLESGTKGPRNASFHRNFHVTAARPAERRGRAANQFGRRAGSFRFTAPYGCRTSPVRVLWVVATPRAFHTGYMLRDTENNCGTGVCRADKKRGNGTGGRVCDPRNTAVRASVRGQVQR